ncbi:MCE family protein [Nocardioides sp. Kera G14]|uniref:MCE family protein n=1 Tax=Nocardioides sp. Kera G14 TaxID=2884264 RepID=UPI001D10C7FC|nr:MCE family protein [Nocardioides sp. Kera G14]UDY22307.1 MCE family protein [Nocardioides sp. Kera G14]
MLMAVSRDTRAEHRRLLVAGIVYVAALALLIGLAIAAYQKAFTPVTWVTVKAERAGLQLPKFGDVRMHGVVVGQIRGVSQDGTQAVIKLGLTPKMAKAIPADATVAIKPTTLFGQKYVEFEDPAQAGGPVGLADGTVIPASRVQTSVELESILGRLDTLLTALRPQDLNATLHALATALSGNGEKLGMTIKELDDYLQVMNVHLPTLTDDLTRFADVAHTYALAAPDLVDILTNATTTATTVSTQKDQIKGLFASVTGVSGSATKLLATNAQGIDVEGKLAVPLLKLLETYSPEYPCLLKGLVNNIPGLNQTFRDGRVRQTMDLGAQQRPAYTPQDRPEYGEMGHGPWCLGLPSTPVIGRPALKDGTEDDSAQHLNQGLVP